MVDKNLEQRIRKAINHGTPDVLDQILTSCNEQKGIGINMNNNVEKNINKKIHRNKWINPLVAVAAALTIICVGGLGINSWNIQHTANSIVMLDVNPSISLEVNSKERVLSVRPHNDDGKKIIGDMDLKNTDLDVAVNALVGSMLQNGYLSDIQNAILVSVEDDNQIKGLELQNKIAQIIDTILKGSQFESAVLSQTVSTDSNIKELAEKYSISEGKAALIREVIQKEPKLTYDTLAPLSVNEIVLLMNSKKISSENVTKIGEVSVKGYISIEEAKAIAYGHAKVTENTVTKSNIEFDTEDGIITYELEFAVGTIEYDYDIHAVTGEIIKFSKDTEDNQSNQSDDDGDDDNDQDENKDEDDNDDDNDDDNQDENEDEDQDDETQDVDQDNSQSSSYIGGSKAKTAAFAHAKVLENQITEIEIQLDREDNLAVYEIKFDTKDAEYEYIINAKNGAIIESEKEAKNLSSSSNQSTTIIPTQPNTEYISKSKAKEVAFIHANVKESVVIDFDSEFKKENKKAVYKIEFETANGEYECVIDAISGKIIKYDFVPIKSDDASDNSQNDNNQDDQDQDDEDQDDNSQDDEDQGDNNQDDDDQGEDDQGEDN